ncbi:MAG: helicase-related protein [bacterium]|nr:helicase-related protein [bacterium]
MDEVQSSAKTQPFFQDNTIFLKKGQSQNMSEFLRKLDGMGYERVLSVGDPGEFSQKGGIIEVFPINMRQAVRLDFLGNTIEDIGLLDITIKDEEKSRQVLQKKLKSQKLFSDLKNLKAGDYLVHLDHGVAKYTGIEKVKIENEKTGAKTEEEYYVLEYASGDKLFVPMGLERKLSRYVGFTDPLVSRLGSLIWQKTKKQIKENVEKLAKELLELYAKKEVVTRKPYLAEKEFESQLQSGFIYEETPDQLQAIEDIKKDLELEKPMDRIVCGDVGFGKTEIAIRIAGLAAANGYQSAIICPTTILASQHFNNFKKRFEKLPVKIALLSRLQSAAEQKRIIKEIGEGKIDIVIGTHRVLSGDITFKNLQLLIIDDEQRFGVKQKERLRQKWPMLDVLSLSATPIPRTIYLALSSFKNISLMQTPPKGRSAITTKILPYNKKEIRQAIEFELARKGQVYFLHNRVETIEKTKNALKKLVPEAEFSFIHGRMQEKELVKIMDEFEKGKTNVLVATTIIENGIDLPNVNTIIIEDASRLGLSQAYQIRGRVGRSHIESFAHLFFPKTLTPIAKERLQALAQAKELGAGYQIAMKDLEIRGAGNILGREQSGSINKIGLNLYCQMLADAVEKSR